MFVVVSLLTFVRASLSWTGVVRRVRLRGSTLDALSFSVVSERVGGDALLAQVNHRA